MHLYKLTQTGQSLSNSTNGANSIIWAIIYKLRDMSPATSDQIADQLGIQEREVLGSLALLKRRKIVEEA